LESGTSEPFHFFFITLYASKHLALHHLKASQGKIASGFYISPCVSVCVVINERNYQINKWERGIACTVIDETTGHMLFAHLLLALPIP